jgi:VanZ family protein
MTRIFSVLETREDQKLLHWRVALALTAVLAIAIAALTLFPVTIPEPMAETSDKIYHVIAFAALALPSAFLIPRAMIWLLPLFVLFGGAIEIIQPYVGRSGEAADFVADIIGIGLGVVFGLTLRGVARFLLAPKLQS